MLGLNFYPHQDVFHTSFRALAIASIFGPLHEDAYRIIEYFVLFPFDLGIIRQRGKEKDRIAAQYDDIRPYKWNATPASTFVQMSEYQNIAVRMLRRKAYLVTDQIALDKELPVDDPLTEKMAEFSEGRQLVIAYLKRFLDEFGVFGEGSLKDRSTLMTFKYDVKRDVTIN